MNTSFKHETQVETQNDSSSSEFEFEKNINKEHLEDLTKIIAKPLKELQINKINMA